MSHLCSDAPGTGSKMGLFPCYDCMQCEALFLVCARMLLELAAKLACFRVMTAWNVRLYLSILHAVLMRLKSIWLGILILGPSVEST